tara:strand:+ start:198 stop:449 length:252 start_codon:yes stop_codon:yes gene_type:complete
MPRYVYKCDECGDEFMVSHLISEEIHKKENCSGACNLHRIPQLTNDPKKIKNKTKKVGLAVDEYIKETGREVAREKKKRMEID